MEGIDLATIHLARSYDPVIAVECIAFKTRRTEIPRNVRTRYRRRLCFSLSFPRLRNIEISSDKYFTRFVRCLFVAGQKIRAPGDLFLTKRYLAPRNAQYRVLRKQREKQIRIERASKPVSLFTDSFFFRYYRKVLYQLAQSQRKHINQIDLRRAVRLPSFSRRATLLCRCNERANRTSTCSTGSRLFIFFNNVILRLRSAFFIIVIHRKAAPLFFSHSWSKLQVR